MNALRLHYILSEFLAETLHRGRPEAEAFEAHRDLVETFRNLEVSVTTLLEVIEMGKTLPLAEVEPELVTEVRDRYQVGRKRHADLVVKAMDAAASLERRCPETSAEVLTRMADLDVLFTRADRLFGIPTPMEN